MFDKEGFANVTPIHIMKRGSSLAVSRQGALWLSIVSNSGISLLHKPIVTRSVVFMKEK